MSARARHRGRRGWLLAALVAPLALAGSACVKPTPVERAMSLARQHREDEGVALLRADLAAHPTNTEDRRLLIRLLAVQGDLGAAREEVAHLAKRLPPGDPSPWIELGHALELVHQWDEAMAAYQTASETAPDSPAGPREAGMRAARWGEWAESQRWLEEAVKRGARGPEVWHTLGLVRLNQRDLDGAREAYRACAAAGAGDDPGAKAVDCWLGLATVALVAHDWAGALAAYDGVMARRPAWGDGELGRAWALARLGRKAEAGRALDRAETLGADAAALAKQRAMLTSGVEKGGGRAP